MKLGLIADTHDNVPMIKRAVAFFNKADVDLVLHAGDYVSPFSLKPLIALQKMAQGRIESSPYITTYGEKKILLGHYFETLNALVSSQEYHLIIFGHTHQPEIRKEAKTLVVNPGECGGWLSEKSTIAVVDLEHLEAKIIELS
ncbi:MAG: metallophosphoesterase [Deltaproteobacteria bacterium]|nr:metallophosphoesterase [Deltaproteobacteria bacterium]